MPEDYVVTLTDAELSMLVDALSVHRAVIETGTPTLSWNDARRMGEDSRHRLGVRLPTSDQILAGKEREALQQKLVSSPRQASAARRLPVGPVRTLGGE